MSVISLCAALILKQVSKSVLKRVNLYHLTSHFLIITDCSSPHLNHTETAKPEREHLQLCVPLVGYTESNKTLEHFA